MRHTALVAALLALAAGGTHAAPKKDFRRKPVAPETTAEVLRGGTVLIRLPGVEGNGNPIRYDISSGPSHGKLSGLTQPDANRQGPGFVTYKHGDDERSTIDRFEYRVYAPISRLRSSPGTVIIRIADLPPRLGAEASMKFSAIAGESEKQALSITNIGGGTLRGQVRARPPFYVDGPDTFELGRKKRTDIVLRYSPTEPGLSAPQKIRPAFDDPSTSIALRGEASPPFAVKTTADKLELKADDSRALAVELVGLSGRPQEIAVEATPPDIVEKIPSAVLGPDESRQIRLIIPSARKGERVDFSVTFATGAHSVTQHFTAPAVPARIELPAVVDFGNRHEAELTVRNSGGVEGWFTLQLPTALKSLEGAASFGVPPDGEKTVRLRLETRSDEPPPAELLVKTGAGEPERVAVHTSLPLPTPTPTASASPSPTPPPSPPTLPGRLNDNVQLVRSDGAWRLQWQIPENYTAVRAERMDAGSSVWRHHSGPTAAGGLWAWLGSLPGRIIGFFAPLESRNLDNIRPDAVPGSKPWQGVGLSESDAKADARWRLTAKTDGSTVAAPITDEFLLDVQADNLRACVPPPPKPQATTSAVSSTPSGTPKTETTDIPPETELLSAQQEVANHSSKLLLAIPYDPAITRYRLERTQRVVTRNPANGLPGRPKIEVIPHEGRVTILSHGKATQGDRELGVVVASIEGLQPGTLTRWRLVPVAGDRDCPPTKVFEVETLPPWRFPWASLWFWVPFALLGVIAWLRWKSRRPPS